MLLGHTILKIGGQGSTGTPGTLIWHSTVKSRIKNGKWQMEQTEMRDIFVFLRWKQHWEESVWWWEDPPCVILCYRETENVQWEHLQLQEGSQYDWMNVQKCQVSISIQKSPKSAHKCPKLSSSVYLHICTIIHDCPKLSIRVQVSEYPWASTSIYKYL